MPRFTLQPRQWYAMECIFPDAHRHVSPIWLKDLQPQGGGDGRIDLVFFHANYPAGVQDKVYSLRVVRRFTGYLLTERLAPDDAERPLILIERITVEWLHRHFPGLGVDARDDADLVARLDRVTGRVAAP